jgi:hypothetical protein
MEGVREDFKVTFLTVNCDKGAEFRQAGKHTGKKVHGLKSAWGEIVRETLYQKKKKKHYKGLVEGVQVVGSEFKSHCKKKKDKRPTDYPSFLRLDSLTFSTCELQGVTPGHLRKLSVKLPF